APQVPRSAKQSRIVASYAVDAPYPLRARTHPTAPQLGSASPSATATTSQGSVLRIVGSSSSFASARSSFTWTNAPNAGTALSSTNSTTAICQSAPSTSASSVGRAFAHCFYTDERQRVECGGFGASSFKETSATDEIGGSARAGSASFDPTPSRWTNSRRTHNGALF